MLRKLLALALALAFYAPAYGDTVKLKTWQQAIAPGVEQIAAVPIYTGSLVVPTGASITDANASASTCVGVNGSLVFVYGTNCVKSVTASGNLSSSGGVTPAITMTASPTFTAVTTTNATVSSLVSGNCVQAGTGGILTTIVGACGVSSGTITAVTGSGNIASSGGTTPNITFTGVLPIANGGTGSGTQPFVDLTTAQTVAGVKTFSSAPVSANGFTAGSSSYTATSATVNGILNILGTNVLAFAGNNAMTQSTGHEYLYDVNAGWVFHSANLSSDVATISDSGGGFFAGMNVSNLSASASTVCTDSSKNLTTSGCLGNPGACSSSSAIICTFNWSCTISSTTNSCTTTQSVPAGAVCEAHFTATPAVTATVSFPVTGGAGGVATGTIAFPVNAYTTLASTTLTIHVVSGQNVSSNFAESGSGQCL